MVNLNKKILNYPLQWAASHINEVGTTVMLALCLLSVVLCLMLPSSLQWGCFLFQSGRFQYRYMMLVFDIVVEYMIRNGLPTRYFICIVDGKSSIKEWSKSVFCIYHTAMRTAQTFRLAGFPKKRNNCKASIDIVQCDRVQYDIWSLRNFTFTLVAF